MKKMIDVISGKEKIKVDGIESAGMITVADNVRITVDGGNNALFVGTQAGVHLVDAFGNELILNDDGLTFAWAGTTDVFTCNFDVFALFKPLILVNYTTAQRPAAPNDGTIIYDSTLKKCILWNGTAWVNLDGTALS